MRSIGLTDLQWALADAIAALRYTRVIELGRQNTHGGVLSVDQHTWGVRCEVAGWRFLKPISWQGYQHDGRLDTLPDLGDFIDVKGVKHRGGTLNLWPGEPARKPGWAFLAIGHHDAVRHNRFDLLGWIWSEEAAPYFADLSRESERKRTGLTFYKRPGYFIPQARLRPVEDLLDIVRARSSRQEARA